MAQISPEWLIQQIDDKVVLFHRYTEDAEVVVVRFDPSNGLELSKAMDIINSNEQLTVKQKSLAHFWSGYFYAHARHD